VIELVILWVKDNWRFVASVAAIVAVFGFGYYKGYSHEHTKFQDHLNADATAMAVAKAENERRLAEQTEITNRIAKEYADAVDKLNDYYKSHPRIIRLCGSSKTDTVYAKGESTSGANKATNGTTETPAIEIDLLKAGQEVLQCQALIEFEKEQDRVQ
jgi:1,6-anhydro-N-acetylmuramate kinase